MNSLTLLKSEEDWSRYRQMFAEASGIVGGYMGWGDGPKSYPCLVSSYKETGEILTDFKVVSCFVYVSDALSLMRAHGAEITEVSKDVQAVNTVGPQQDGFNRGVACHIGAILDILRDTGIITPEKYKEYYLRTVSEVDQNVERDHQKILEHAFGGKKKS